MVYVYPEDWSAENWGAGDPEENPYFECDDLIAPAIIELNRKGYTTTECCSGHPYRILLREQAYVRFTKDYQFTYLPENWKWDTKYNCLVDALDLKDDLYGFAGVEKLVALNKSLYAWAQSLPFLIK